MLRSHTKVLEKRGDFCLDFLSSLKLKQILPMNKVRDQEGLVITHTRRCGMEKLSGILPSNSRVTSVDLETGPPVRPGAPSFGRKVGQNTIKDKVTLSNQAKEMALQDSFLTGKKNPKEVAQAKMVEDLSKKFFETRLQKPAVEVAQPVSEQVMNNQVEALNVAPVIATDLQAIAQYDVQEPAASTLNIEA